MTTWNRDPGDVNDTIVVALSGIQDLNDAISVLARVTLGDVEVVLAAAVTDPIARQVTVQLGGVGGWLPTATPGKWSFRIEVTFIDASVITWPTGSHDYIVVASPMPGRGADEPCVDWDFEQLCCDIWLDCDTVVPDPDPNNVAGQLRAQAYAKRWVSAFLWKRSRRRIGLCTNTVRICPPYCMCAPCACGPAHVLPLSMDSDIVSIVSITNVCSGEVIDPSRYRVVNGSGVGLVDGSCSWMVGASLACELEIVYTYGVEPDIEALSAAADLACAFVKSCLKVSCRSDQFLTLKAGFQKIGRRQVVLTGVPLVDQWLLEVRGSSPAGMLDPSDLAPYTVS